MKGSNMKRIFLLIMLFFLFQGIGCGTVKSAYRASVGAARSVSEMVIPGEKDMLRERVMVVPVINQAGIEEETAMRITGIFMDLLTKEGHLLVTMLKDVETSSSDLSSPQYGIVIDPELVKKAEETGMDVLITTTLSPFDVKTKKSGIWPFRKMKKEIDISISMNVLDITNGTLILSETETRKIKAGYDPVEGKEDRWEVDNEILEEEVYSILKTYSSDITDALDAQPWTGKIKLADDKAVMINGGKDIGITKGSIFEVFDKGEPIQSINGKDYFYLGMKVAEVRAEEVMQKYTLAAPLNNERLIDGQLVRLKR
jgi:hypothetical protein